MKLFSSKSEKDLAPQQERIEGLISLSRIGIVSMDADTINRVNSVLALYNIIRVNVIRLSLYELQTNKAQIDELDAIIIEIDQAIPIEDLLTVLNNSVPVGCRIFILGNTDSISYANSLAKFGIDYIFNDQATIQKLPYLIAEPKDVVNNGRRKGNIMTFLGCKGGVGTSNIVYHVVKAMSAIAQIPVLIIQGASGSGDLDFIVEKPIEKDGSITEIDKNIFAINEPAASAWNYEHTYLYEYNLNVIDHNINSNAMLGHATTALSHSNTIILTFNRNPYSIKIAKAVIETKNRLITQNQQIADKRFLLCLNDNVPFNKKTMLQYDDIEEFLEHKIDFHIPYLNQNKKLLSVYSNNKQLKKMASALIGIKHEKGLQPEQNSAISSLLMRFKLQRDK